MLLILTCVTALQFSNISVVWFFPICKIQNMFHNVGAAHLCKMELVDSAGEEGEKGQRKPI